MKIIRFIFVFLCMLMMMNLIGCSAGNEISGESDTLIEADISNEVTGIESSTDDKTEETSEEVTEMIQNNISSPKIVFSLETAPKSLPGSSSNIIGEFIADFENADNYFQGAEKTETWSVRLIVTALRSCLETNIAQKL